MHRSVRKSLERNRPLKLARMPLAAAICFAISSTAFAQADAPPADQAAEPSKATPTLSTVTVTAQKRTENLQKVPISIQAINETKLKQADVLSFNDYAKMIPSLSFGTAGGGVFSGPGFVQVYMRGVSSGGDGNHSASQPSVGMYLDEQPITTIQGALDIHMYDIDRVEALAGPQGTLYGASSQSGTVRIITKKPDTSAFASSFAAELNVVHGGGTGHVLDGMVNIPLSSNAAIRMVAWERHDAGYVDNVPGTLQFPIRDDGEGGLTSWGGVLDSTNCVSTATHVCYGSAKDNYNDADTAGARVALKIDLNDNWTVTPSIIAQKQTAHGSTGFDPQVGDLKVLHFNPEASNDHWNQAALTLEGKIGNFELTYAFSHLKRDVDDNTDYTDYAFWYDTLASYGNYFYDNDGTLINPSQFIHNKDGYTKTSHELRIASPGDNRVRFVGGLFWQEQQHEIFQDLQVTGLADFLEVPGHTDTIWLTDQERRDRDQAVFGELSFDATDRLTFTGGLRHFKSNNSLKGFFGYGAGFSGSTGESQCFATDPQFSPCVNLDKSTSETGTIGRFNATWKIDDDKLIYGTWSEGYRPGGINRRGTLPPYKSDYITNYEFGWKTSWADNRLRWNGAIFREDWKDFQFAYLGTNGLTEIRNANQARIDGLETDVTWAATYNLSITGGAAFYNARLTEDYCQATDANGVMDPSCFGSLADRPDFAASGTRLPITPRFKGNLNARYSFDLWQGDAFWQASLVHVGSRSSDLREKQGALLGDLDAYTLLDLSVGYHHDNWSFDVFLKNATDERAELAKFSECAASTCGFQTYTVTTPPRTLGIRFSKEL